MQAGVTMRERGATTPRPLTMQIVGGSNMARATVTQARLKEALNYDPETGVFTRNGCKVGSDDGAGYLQASVGNCSYRLHRLAWLYVHGEWPNGVIDHINGDRSDNRIANLRDVSQRANTLNVPLRKTNKSGISGVWWHARIKRWRVSIDGKNHLGHFSDFFEACCARKSAENKFWQQN
jgi:hypothetical protein